MSETLTIVATAGGGAALLALLAAFLLAREVSQRELAQRLRHVVRSESAVRAPVGRSPADVLLGLVAQVGATLRATSMLSPEDARTLERSAQAAGYRGPNVIPVIMGGKILLMVFLPVLAFAVMTSSGYSTSTRNLATAAAFIVGMLGPNWVLAWARRSQAAALRRGLPDALDLLVVCAEAGLGLETAIDRVALEMRPSSPAVAQEFALLGQELRLSSDRRAALTRMGDRTDLESFRRLAATLSQTLRYGTPLGRALRVLASELRTERLMQMEERAAKLPALLTLPLILFILPCLFIVLVGPAVIQTLNVLSH